MASLKHYLFLGAAAAALATTSFAAPVFAQYREFQSEKPSVEVDLGALGTHDAAPAGRPAWQKPPESDLGAHPAPVVLRQPLPPQQQQKPAVVPAVPVQQAAPPPRAPEPPAAAAPAPRRVLKPLFAAPVTPPLAEAPPVQPLAEPVPARVPPAAKPAAVTPQKPVRQRIETPPPAPAATAEITAPSAVPPTLPRAKLMEPIYEQTPHITRPAPKPAHIPAQTEAAAIPATEQVIAPAAAPAPVAAASAPAAESRLSYPPAKMPRSDVRHFERPVLPEGLRSDEYAAPVKPAATAKAPAGVMSAEPPKQLPQRKPPVASLPETILNDDEMAALPSDVAAEEITAFAAEVPEELAAPAQSSTPTPTAAAVPERRPSLVVIEDAPVDLPRRMPVTTTITAPAFASAEDMDDAEAVAVLPAPKPLENIPPPLTEPELAAISRNVEAVPARVAVAPPRLQPQDIAVPTLADLTLEFDGASSELDDNVLQKLVNIVPHLTENEGRRLAVHAYASGEDGSKSSARRISLSRALAVRAFLMDNGVPPTRVDVRALGLETDRKPLERVDLVFAR